MSENPTIHAGQSTTQNASISKRRLWTGGAMSTLAALFLFVDGVMKLVKPASVVEATVQLGYPENVILGIGVFLLVCVVLYVIPKTSILGAILLNRLSRWRHCHPRTRGQSTFLPYALPGLSCPADLGRAFVAR